MSHYHEPEDLKLLPQLKQLAPEEFKGFVALDSIIGREGGAIPQIPRADRDRHRLHDAVSLLSRRTHASGKGRRDAREVAEAVFLSAALRAGAPSRTAPSPSSCSTTPDRAGSVTGRCLLRCRFLPPASRLAAKRQVDRVAMPGRRHEARGQRDECQDPGDAEQGDRIGGVHPEHQLPQHRGRHDAATMPIAIPTRQAPSPRTRRAAPRPPFARRAPS